MKNVKFQNNLILTVIIAIIAAALLAHTGIVWIAMLGGFVISMIASFLHKKQTKNLEFKEMSTLKVSSIAALLAALGSQTGWVALLI